MANEQEKKITKKDLVVLFWRSFLLQSAFSFERMQTLGFVWVVMPMLEKLNTSKDELVKALKRHFTFFNTFPFLVTPILGMVAKLEEQIAAGSEEVEEKSVESIKGALMGPLAGIGDSFFWGAWRPITAGIAIPFAMQGNIIAPFIFLVLFNIPHILVRWYGTFWGYELGDQFINELEGLQIKKWINGATILGLMVVGSLVASWLNITTPLAYTIEDTSIALQDTFDQIMPNLLPLATTLLVYYWLRKGLSAVKIMGIILAIGLVGGYFGILG